MATEDAPLVGVIGLGLVGSALVDRLRGAGFRVVGHDIDPTKTAGLPDEDRAESPAALAARARRIVLSLPDSDVVAQVVDALPPVELIVDTTTGAPDVTDALARRLAAQGTAYIDAPLSGSSAQIRRGDAALLVGGDPDALDTHADLLAALSERVFCVGPVGAGSRAKLASNLVLGLNRAALAEGLVLAERLGLDPAAFLDVLRATPAYSAAMDVKGRRMVTGTFDPPDARLAQHRKDVALMLACAAETDQRLPLTEAHAALLDAAIAAGDGALDNAAVIQALRRARP